MTLNKNNSSGDDSFGDHHSGNILSNLSNNPLGKKVKYADSYDSSLLFPIERKIGRSKIFSSADVEQSKWPFQGGYDIWNCYEVSWLALSGKPEVRIITFAVPYSSPNLVESKSLKLYLNSFNNTKFEDENQVAVTIKQDLSKVIGAQIELKISNLIEADRRIEIIDGQSLDDLDITLDNYTMDPDPAFLVLEKKIGSVDDRSSHGDHEIVSERLYSDLLRSNCLVTGQPDWGSVLISYEGKRINRKSLLKYIVSFRNHVEFHEQCVERIFNDITKQCSPSKLTVYARYTRRGGIDINPIRSSHAINLKDIDNARLVRQ